MSEHFTRFRGQNPDGRGPAPVAEREPPKPTRSQKIIEYTMFALFGMLLLVAGFAVWSQYDADHKKVPNYIAEGFTADRLNILLIGIGGDTHIGGGKDMADAILLISLKPSTKQVSIISVPRDLWVHVRGYGTHRLSRLHTIGNQGGYPGAGPGLLVDTISDVFGQPVHGFVRLDFAAFSRIIDDLGGVDVYCPRSFHDYLFDDGFAKGWHHLSGKRALAYARYRYVRASPDGNNFGREMRQQQIIAAVQEKLRSRQPGDVARMIKALQTLSKHTDTNLRSADMWRIYRTFGEVRRENVRNVSLQPLTEIFQVMRFGDPGEAVRPRTGDFSQIQALARDVFRDRAPIATRELIVFTASPPAPAKSPMPVSQ